MASLANTEWTGLIVPPRPPGPYGGGPSGLKVQFLSDGSARWKVQMQPNRRWQTDDSVQWMTHIQPHLEWAEWTDVPWRWEQRGDIVQFGTDMEKFIGTLSGQMMSGTNRYEGMSEVKQFSLELTGII